jgi:hypothetical protein
MALVKDSQHVGEAGKPLRGMSAKIEFVRAMEGGTLGPSTPVKFLDDAGNVLTSVRVGRPGRPEHSHPP